MDLRFKHPFTSVLASCTKGGKTTWAINFVKQAHNLITPPPEKIFWAYTEWQDAYNELPFVTFIEGVPDVDILKAHNGPKLLICDDLMTKYKKEDLCRLFSQGSHHWNLSVMYIVQNLFYSNLRNARINSHYLILMKNPSDRLQLYTLARQIYPSNQKFLIEAFDDACSKQFGYLLIDLEPSTDDNFRLRTNIFDEIGCVYQYK